jgi:hypothetical protein
VGAQCGLSTCVQGQGQCLGRCPRLLPRENPALTLALTRLLLVYLEGPTAFAFDLLDVLPLIVATTALGTKPYGLISDPILLVLGVSETTFVRL